MSKTHSTSTAPSLLISRAPMAPAVWTIDEEVPRERASFTLHCCKDDKDRQGTCCKELKPSDKRALVDSNVVRDVIIGLSDGLTVPFALTAGLSGVGSSRFVVLAGVAELISGAISMGVGGYFSAQAEREQYQFQLRAIQERVQRSCSKGLADETNDILEPYGAPKELVSLLVGSLQRAEQPNEAVATRSALQNRIRLCLTRSQGMSSSAQEKRGLTPFLVEFGKGLAPISSTRAYTSALTIGFSYMLGGLVPLLPYIIIKNVRTALFVSIGIAATLLLLFGVVKQHVSGAKCGLRGYSFGALSTLGVGGMAAAASYGIVKGIEGSQKGGL